MFLNQWWLKSAPTTKNLILSICSITVFLCRFFLSCCWIEQYCYYGDVPGTQQHGSKFCYLFPFIALVFFLPSAHVVQIQNVVASISVAHGHVGLKMKWGQGIVNAFLSWGRTKQMHHWTTKTRFKENSAVFFPPLILDQTLHSNSSPNLQLPTISSNKICWSVGQ